MIERYCLGLKCQCEAQNKEAQLVETGRKQGLKTRLWPRWGISVWDNLVAVFWWRGGSGGGFKVASDSKRGQEQNAKCYRTSKSGSYPQRVPLALII